MNKNGFIIQDINHPLFVPKTFIYNGINAFAAFPLESFNDDLARELTKRQQTKLVDKKHVIQEFISDQELLKEYCKSCADHGLSIRLLFLESDYSQEAWMSESPATVFLGYEYCPVPIDFQIVSDLDWMPQLHKYVEKLNKHGLFDAHRSIKEFKLLYNKLLNINIAGDGLLPEDIFIFKVYEVLVEKIVEAVMQ